MKKSKLIVQSMVIMLLFIIFVFYCCKHQYDNNIIINNKCTKIKGIWLGEIVEVNEDTTISKVVEHINSMDKSFEFIHRQTNKSPDSILIFTDIYDNDVELWIYGNYILYKSKQYKVNYKEIELIGSIVARQV